MKIPLLWTLLALFLLSACQEQEPAPDTDTAPVRPVQVWQTQTQITEQMDNYTGEVQPRQAIDFAFRVAGKVVARHVDVGERVTKGQALARLDDEDARLSVKQTEADLQANLGNLSSTQSNLNGAQGRLSSARANRLAAQANLESTQTAVETARSNASAAQAAVDSAQAEVQNAQLEYQRSRQLVDQNFASKAVLDRDTQRLQTAHAKLASAQANAAAAQSQVQSAQARVKTSRAQLEAIDGEIATATANITALNGQIETAQARVQRAQEQIKLTQNQSNYTMLKSNVDGVVTASPVESGQVVAAGQTIVQIAQEGEYDVHIRVGEQAIAALEIGKAATISLWAAPDQPNVIGRVREIAPDADTSRTWLVKLTMENAPSEVSNDVRLGMTASVAFHQTLDKDMVWLPATALFQRSADQAAVWLLDETNTVQLSPVTVERYLPEGLLVSGLDSGLSVIAAGVNRLYEGQTVRPIPYNGEARPRVNP